MQEAVPTNTEVPFSELSSVREGSRSITFAHFVTVSAPPGSQGPARVRFGTCIYATWAASLHQ